MFDFATAWLLQHKVLLPAASTLTRITKSVSGQIAACGESWHRYLTAGRPHNWQGYLRSQGQRMSLWSSYAKVL
jgi:hypothetical protein